MNPIRPEILSLEPSGIGKVSFGFQDDPAQVTEQFLLDILTVWYEEAT